MPEWVAPLQTRRLDAKPFFLPKKMFSKLSRLMSRAGKAEKTTLLTLCLAAVSLYVFIVLADEVIEGDTQGFDSLVLLAFRDRSNPSVPVGPDWFGGMMRDFTALGSVAVLSAISAMVVGFLVLTRKSHAAWMVVGSLTSGVLASSLLKWAFARPRPDLALHATVVYTQSFPSGHAMLSAIVYLTLGSLLARTQTETRVKIYLLATAAMLTLIVGVSRVYLGVHWPTDVLAGWAGGSAWALLCWLAMLWLQGKGTVEPPGDGPASASNADS